MILQAPGVAQDSYGQLHVRGDHANLQYRINGVQLPEGITGFGQVLSPRFAQSISLLTGALPAQYGLRTAGVIDIKTKDGSLDNLADVDFYGGQRGTDAAELPVRRIEGQLQLLHDRAIPAAPIAASSRRPRGPRRSTTPATRAQVFGYFSYFLNPTTRLSLITGTAINHFQIPANPDQPQVFALTGCRSIRRRKFARTSSSRTTSTCWRCRAPSARISITSSRRSAATRRLLSIPITPAT